MTTFNVINLNADQAKKADQEGGRINRTDKYVGTIERLEFIVAKKGTQGVDVFFMSGGKEDARLTLWTNKADGTPIFGLDKLHALMTVAQVRTLTPTDTQIEKYDRGVGAKILQPVTVAPEMAGKRVGLLIQMEEYRNDEGGISKKATYVSAFQADTGLMAKEILERKTKPEQLDKAYARLIKNGDKLLQGNTNVTVNNSYGAAPQGQLQGYGSKPTGAGGAISDLDDDLPFSPVHWALA